jgi:hypothetical protein
LRSPYEAYLQDTLENLTLDEIENLMEFEPNEVECEVWGITPDECTRALEEAARVKRKERKD